MIPVDPQPEPDDFDVRVRQPGNEFLRRNPAPTNSQLRNKNYWTRSLPQLRTAYASVCAYSACWIPTQGTVDHYVPKSARPNLAYEWDNFRLAWDRLNNYKGENRDVADPMSVRAGWFTLDFHSFFVKSGNGLSQEITRLVNRTINILRLNADDVQVNLRFHIVEEYARGDVTMAFLERKYPFIAAELQRQGLVETIKDAFRGI